MLIPEVSKKELDLLESTLSKWVVPVSLNASWELLVNAIPNEGLKLYFEEFKFHIPFIAEVKISDE